MFFGIVFSILFSVQYFFLKKNSNSINLKRGMTWMIQRIRKLSNTEACSTTVLSHKLPFFQASICHSTLAFIYSPVWPCNSLKSLKTESHKKLYQIKPKP